MALYVPGYGLMSREEIDVDRACRNHDTDLTFRRSERTGNFTIFQRLQREHAYVKHADAADLEQGDLFPLCAFPGRRIPSVDEVNRWLYENDQNRQDTLERVQKHNAKVRARMDADMQAQIHERAVFLEHGFRALGEDTGRTVSLPNDGKRRRTAG